MGICLGAQLVARAFRDRVYPHTVPEPGFSPLRVANTASVDQLLREQVQIYAQDSAQFADRIAEFWLNLMTRSPITQSVVHVS